MRSRGGDCGPGLGLTGSGLTGEVVGGGLEAGMERDEEDIGEGFWLAGVGEGVLTGASLLALDGVGAGTKPGGGDKGVGLGAGMKPTTGGRDMGLE